MKTLITLLLIAISLSASAQFRKAALKAKQEALASAKQPERVQVPVLPDDVDLTEDELIELRGSGEFRQYLVQKIIGELANILGQSSFTTTTSLWYSFATKKYLARPTIVTNDPGISDLAVTYMITAGLDKKDNAVVGDLVDQVIDYLEGAAPSSVPQNYLTVKSNAVLSEN